MPDSDLILNVRQIAGYPNLGIQATDNVLIQRGGLGGPYLSVTAQQFVAQALVGGGPLDVGAGAPTDAFGSQIFTDNLCVALGATHNWNCYFALPTNAFQYLTTGPAAAAGYSATAGFVWGSAPAGAPGAIAAITDWMTLSPAGELTLYSGSLTLGRDPAGPMEAATAQWVESVVAGLRAETVWSFNGRRGDVTLWIQDILKAGGAPIWSPRFTGKPMAETPAPWSNSERLATTAFVHMANKNAIDCLLQTQPFVFTFNGRSGDVVLSAEDLAGAEVAFAESPTFTGIPTAPTAPPGTNTTQLATCEFVTNAIATSSSSILTQVANTYAPINAPAFTGMPTALTAPPGTSTGQLATTAFVMNAVTSATAGVASWNGRTGAVVLEPIDIQDVGGALTNSPNFTGVPTAPTAAFATNTNQIATCAFVIAELGGASVGVMSFNGRGGVVTLQAADITGAGGALTASPAFTGVPTAPTAASGTSTNQLATTAFVEAAITTNAGVTSFMGRTGDITLTFADVSAAGGLANPSPALTGTPTAPTAATATNNTQIATTAFVYAAIAAGSVQTFNGRSGAVALTQADVTGVLSSSAANPLMNGVANPGSSTAWSRGDHVHPSDTSRLALSGGTLTGALGGTAATFSGNLIASGVTVSNGVVQINRGTQTNPNLYLNDGTTNRSVFYFNVANGATTLLDVYSGANITIAPTGAIGLNTMGGAATSTGPLAATTMTATSLAIGGLGALQNSAGYLYSGSGFMAPVVRWSGANGLINPNGVYVVGDIAQMAITGSGASPSGLQFSCTNAGGTVAYFIWVSATSDIRIKENIGPTQVDALAAICAIPVRAFDYQRRALDALRPSGAGRLSTYHMDIGLIAQEVAECIPDMDAVAPQPESRDPSIPADLHTINLPNAVPYLIRAIQQLEARVRELEGRTLH